MLTTQLESCFNLSFFINGLFSMIIMRKKICFFVIFNITAVITNGQAKFIMGFLRDSITHYSIAEGAITNATTNTIVQTDKNGFFRLRVSPNDFIYAVAKSYHYDTLKYSFINTDTVTIYLSPVGDILPNVTVTTHYNKYQLDSMQRRADFEKLRGTNYGTLSKDHPSGFGLTFNFDPIFRKNDRVKRNAAKTLSKVEQMAYVNYRYSPHMVAYFTGFKGDTLSTFMNRYRPDYSWLRQHVSNEEVMLYINDKLKEYKASLAK